MKDNHLVVGRGRFDGKHILKITKGEKARQGKEATSGCKSWGSKSPGDTRGTAMKASG